MFIDIHVLQYIPLSCINRDDAGMPKTVTISGVRRARWSSYSQKRLLRARMRQLLPQGSTSIRTRRLPAMVAEELEGLGASKEQRAAALAALFTVLGEPKKAKKAAAEKTAAEKNGDGSASGSAPAQEETPEGLVTATMVTVPDGAPRAVAQAVLDGGTDLKLAVRNALARVPLDVALSGRFIAELDMRTDGALSVAHAVGTGPDGFTSEFWTAVDDLATEQGHGGSGLLGTQGLTSGVLYRYASIDLDELDQRIAEAGASPSSRDDLVRLAVREFARLRPEAMKRSTGPSTEPSLVQVDVTDSPRSLVSAFTAPVRGHDVVAASVERLEKHAEILDGLYGGPEASLKVSTVADASLSLDEVIEMAIGAVARARKAA